MQSCTLFSLCEVCIQLANTTLRQMTYIVSRACDNFEGNARQDAHNHYAAASTLTGLHLMIDNLSSRHGDLSLSLCTVSQMQMAIFNRFLP